MAVTRHKHDQCDNTTQRTTTMAPKRNPPRSQRATQPDDKGKQPEGAQGQQGMEGQAGLSAGASGSGHRNRRLRKRRRRNDGGVMRQRNGHLMTHSSWTWGA